MINQKWAREDSNWGKAILKLLSGSINFQYKSNGLLFLLVGSAYGGKGEPSSQIMQGRVHQRPHSSGFHACTQFFHIFLLP